MKNLLKVSVKLFAFVFVLFLGSCGNSDDTDPVMELYSKLEIQFEVQTLEPIVDGLEVQLSGDILKVMPEHSVKYGFLWSLDVKCPTPNEMGSIDVGEGVFKGLYSINTSDLPKDIDLRVCAFIISSSDQRIRIVGEEFNFRY